ncbi:hypothetical protein ACM614_19065 [Streptomyces sp. 12297]
MSHAGHVWGSGLYVAYSNESTSVSAFSLLSWYASMADRSSV